MKIFLSVLLACCLFTFYSNATVRTSVASGSWNNTATWGGTVPNAGDDVVISAGNTVTINVNPNNITNVTVSGTLQFDATGAGRIWTVTGNFTINSGGTFNCASPSVATTHTFNYNGTTFTNNGTMNMVNGSNKCNIVIGGSVTQTIGGSSTLNLNKLTLNNSGGKFIIDYGGGSFTPSESSPTKLTTSISTSDSLVIKQGLLIGCALNSATISHTVANLGMGSSSSKITSSVNVFTSVTTITVNTGLILNDATNAHVSMTVNGTFSSPNMLQSNSAIAMALIGPNCQGGTNNSTICTINGETNLPDLFGFAGNAKLFGGIEPKRPDMIFNGSVYWQYSKSHTIDIPFTSDDFFIKTFFFGIFDSIGTHPRIILNGGTAGTPNTFNIPFEVFDAPIQTSSPLGNLTTAQISESAADWVVNGNWKIVSGASMAVHTDDSLTINGSLRVASGGEIAGSETETEPSGYVAINGPLLLLSSNETIYIETGTGLGKGTLAEAGSAVAFKNKTADIDWNLLSVSNYGTVDYSAGATQTITDRTYNNLSLSGSFIKKLVSDITVNGKLTIASGVAFTNSGFNTIAKGAISNDGSHSGSGKISLNGTSIQALSGAGTDWGNIQLNNSTGATCVDNVTSSGIVNFDAGILSTSSSAKLSLTSTGNCTGGSNSSYVNGPLSKSTASTSEFIFPVGKGGTFRQISIVPEASATTWTAEYFNSSYSNISSVQPPITSVSNSEYWILNRNTGTAKGKVKLYWGSSSGLTDTLGLRVSRWNGSKWTNAGKTAATGNSSSGTITSALVNSFSPFTFGEANEIATTAVGSSSFCPEAALNVSFTSAGTFNSGNIYTAQLSNATGSFSNPKNIGTLSSTANSGTIAAILPSNAGSGNGFRIRVVSSNPPVTGSNNGSNIQILACAAPTGLTATGISSSSATINWSNIPCAAKYNLQYRKQGNTTWTSKKVIPNTYTISGLLANTTYEYHVQTFCTITGSTKSAYTAIQTFTTALKMSELLMDGETSVQLFPNPSSGQVTVSIVSNRDNAVVINIYDAIGRTVMQQAVNLVEGNNNILLNVSTFPAGVFYLELINDGNKTVKKLVKE